ncbi:MAG: hypothetical protein GWN07_10360, partial [Actinobacteria bacterium]|nr:hypothetical protein [Actinomycetota bacterium]NIS30678.1 hypothetical protein [Actinomycetota bacterium]NIU65890.1 hypothetical protein [Actinomycetota bacterium]NIV86768.1 hypothetical protein [Actinomycetota bacterium]NIW27682.1 hypothetical protein [Actinomycetota bacterium]
MGHHVEQARRVVVHPPRDGPAPATARPPGGRHRFVADVHLGALARHLRLLGFDTWWRADADDALLATRSAADERVLLSRDRQLLMRRVVAHGYCPR